MALIDEVRARYSASRLRGLTNPQKGGTSAEDTARLDLAVEDTLADFEIEVGVIYLNTDRRHVAVGVMGVIENLRLRVVQGATVDDKTHQTYLKKLKALARVTARDRILPEVTVPDGEPRASDGSRPMDFDRRRFDGLVLESPRRRDGDSDFIHTP